MAKDLTNSRIDRQNILNNDLAIMEIQEVTNVQTIFFDEKYYLTKEAVATYFEVDVRTIERYISSNGDELKYNGYEVLKGKKLKTFLEHLNNLDVTDINVGNISNRTPQLALFDFKAFLNIAMLLSESEQARILRQVMLDVFIDLINKKTGGGTKYINQRDKDYIFSSIQEENYRKQFTDSLKNYVAEDRYKYACFTDLIYVSIFKEKANEYKKILKLKASDKVRDTFYSEILDIIAAYESGFAETLNQESDKLNRKLSLSEAKSLFASFEKMALWKPLIKQGRIKMASRDMALREAFHYQLSEYIKPLDKDEYQKFLGATGDELERLMAENQDVLKRLKERE